LAKRHILVCVCAYSSADRAPASGAGCAGSSPARRTIFAYFGFYGVNMLETLAPLIQWMEQWLLAVNPGSLFFLSFIESIFFPIPPDALLLPLSVLRPHMAPLFG